MAETDSVPLWWLLVFLLVALGVGAAAVLAVGGSLVSSLLLPAVG
ncbi:MAG: hypothetical protein ABEI75_01950 [Halobaculum sp.]